MIIHNPTRDVSTEIAKLFMGIDNHKLWAIGSYIHMTPAGWRPMISGKVRSDKMISRMGDNGKIYCHLPLSLKTIQAAYKSIRIIGKRFRGARYLKDNKCLTDYILFDIDAPGKNGGGSMYHPANNPDNWIYLIKLIEHKLGRFIVIRSSDSGGYHIYVWFDREVDCDIVAKFTHKFLTGAGIPVSSSGGIEIFPNLRANENDLFNGHRLPCINPNESYVVNPYTLSYEGDAEIFVEKACDRVSADILFSDQVETSAPKIQTAKTYGSKGLYPDDHEIFRWTGSSQSNATIGSIAKHVIKYRGVTDPDAAIAECWSMMEKNGYYEFASKREQQDIRHVNRWVKYHLKKINNAEQGYKGRKGGSTETNEQRRNRCIEKIIQVCKVLLKSGLNLAELSWTAISKTIQAITASLGLKGFSNKTLFNYSTHPTHPGHREIIEKELNIATHSSFTSTLDTPQNIEVSATIHSSEEPDSTPENQDVDPEIEVEIVFFDSEMKDESKNCDRNLQILERKRCESTE
jgi:hypothetical protein